VKDVKQPEESKTEKTEVKKPRKKNKKKFTTDFMTAKRDFKGLKEYSNPEWRKLLKENLQSE
jgi:hypothetical protein